MVHFNKDMRCLAVRCVVGYTLLALGLGVSIRSAETDEHCPPISAPASGRMVGKDADKMYGMVFFECKDGYKLIGTPVRVCQIDRTWTGSQPICKPDRDAKPAGIKKKNEPKTCQPSLKDPEHGKVNGPRAPTAGAKAEFSCGDGFELDGQDVIECGENGKWKDAFPTCKPVECRKLRPPDAGDIEYDADPIGINAKAKYLCDPGFKLVGPGVRTCERDGSWSGNSPNCEAIDYCASKPCGNGGSCLKQEQGFICTCNEGFRGDKCEERIQCNEAPSPVNGFKLESGAGNFVGNMVTFGCNKGFNLKGSEKRTCQSTGEWDGIAATCSKEDFCGVMPCENGGKCVNSQETPVGYTCTCLAGFEGDRCQTKTSVCASKPCKNQGECVEIGEQDFKCTCPRDYGGTLCEIQLLPCDHHPCLNGGSCINTQTGGFVCKCPDDLRGERCETRYNPCMSFPCLHDGKCLVGNYPEGFICECPTGFQGVHCDYNVDFCKANPCQNGGICKSGFDSFQCICRPGYGGEICSTVIDHCAAGACLNGGMCQNGEDSFLCSCKPGFHGQRCENGFTCPDEYGTFPDPADCSRYFHCSTQVAYHKNCPAGLHFSPKLLTCDWPNEAGCE
ncbi:unnamed protein product [Owenia fusiformis]|uniref:Uncharacterized protein n=1 Tax=Owenia fusiformis TaxID=6347 RepID=A0A8J1UDN6_OWEFU|nr:unnamed protein product [Owenia fusiformis]